MSCFSTHHLCTILPNYKCKCSFYWRLSMKIVVRPLDFEGIAILGRIVSQLCAPSLPLSSNDVLKEINRRVCLTIKKRKGRRTTRQVPCPKKTRLTGLLAPTLAGKIETKKQHLYTDNKYYILVWFPFFFS